MLLKIYYNFKLKISGAILCKVYVEKKVQFNGLFLLSYYWFSIICTVLNAPPDLDVVKRCYPREYLPFYSETLAINYSLIGLRCDPVV